MLLRDIPDYASVMRLNCVVNRIEWQPGRAKVSFVSRASARADRKEWIVQCARLVVTVPLGVLQQAPGGTGAIQFAPEPKTILRSAGKLEVGQVYRITFRFSTRFLEDDTRLSFMLSQEKRFPVWWTAYPVLAGCSQPPSRRRFSSRAKLRISLDTGERYMEQSPPGVGQRV